MKTKIKITNCCKTNKKTKKCVRKTDDKIFSFPRLYSQKQCQQMTRKKGYKNLGFTARSSCAPYKGCSLRQKGGKTKKRGTTKKREKTKREKTKREKNKTKKEKGIAIAVLHQNPYKITGEVEFIPLESGAMRVNYKIKGLKDGKHGFHIHEYGDLRDGCESACAHFNPYGKKHGCISSKERHLGDLGNVVSKNKMARGTIVAPDLSLYGKHGIIGRMIIVHKDEDDCGNYKGNDQKKASESKKTGNAGERVACGVIGGGGVPL